MIFNFKKRLGLINFIFIKELKVFRGRLIDFLKGGRKYGNAGKKSGRENGGMEFLAKPKIQQVLMHLLEIASSCNFNSAEGFFNQLIFFFQ